MNEKEAFDLLTNNSRWRRQDIKMIGMSDGTTYYNTIRDAKKSITDKTEAVKEVKTRLNRYVAGHDKLLFEEFVDEEDERVKRAQELIKKTNEELAPLEDELEDLKKNIIKKALDAELEKARGNMVNPRDFSVIGKTTGNAMHQKVLENFTQAKRVI